jgi:hypothetical protein
MRPQKLFLLGRIRHTDSFCALWVSLTLKTLSVDPVLSTGSLSNSIFFATIHYFGQISNFHVFIIKKVHRLNNFYISNTKLNSNIILQQN